jgi:hypothetical protein
MSLEMQISYTELVSVVGMWSSGECAVKFHIFVNDAYKVENI